MQRNKTDLGRLLLAFGRAVVMVAILAAVVTAAMIVFAEAPAQPAESSPEPPGQVTALATESRSLTLTLNSVSLALSAQAQFDRGDPRATAIVDGRLNPSWWFFETFGDFKVNGDSIAFLMTGAIPQYTVSASDVTVKVNMTLTERLMSTLELTMTDRFPTLATDRITLHVSDYTLKAIRPMPMTYSGGQASWAGAQSGSTLAADLDYSGPGKVLYYLQRQPDLGSGWDALLLIPYAVFAVVPIAVVIWLAVRLRESAQGQRDDSSRTASRLLAVWVGAALSVYIFTAAEIVASTLNASNPDDVTWFLSRMVVAALVTVLAAVLVLAARRTRMRPDGKAISLLVARGILLGGVMVTLFYVAVWYLPQPVPKDEWQATSFAMGFAILAGLTTYTAGELNRMARPQTQVRLAVLLLISIAVIGVAFPWPSRLVGDQFTPTWTLVYATLAWIPSDLASIGPIATLFVLVFVLRRDFPWMALEERWVIVFLFAAFVVGLFPVLFYVVPLSFVLALGLGLLMLQPDERMRMMASVRGEVVEHRQKWLVAALKAVRAEDLSRAAEDSLARKARSGDLAPDEYTRQRDEDEAYAQTQRDESRVGDLYAREVVLVFGPYDSAFDNGILGMKLGAALGVPVVVLQLALLGFPYTGQVQYPLLYVAIQIASSAVVWPASGFFFGYFLPALKFGSGLSKGLMIGLVAALIKLPQFIFGIQSVAETTLTVLSLAYTIVFFALIGLVFDYLTWRRAFSRPAAARAVQDFAGLQPAVAALGVALPSLGLTLLTALTGQFGQLLSLLLHFVTPPSPPAGP